MFAYLNLTESTLMRQTTTCLFLLFSSFYSSSLNELKNNKSILLWWYFFNSYAFTILRFYDLTLIRYTLYALRSYALRILKWGRKPSSGGGTEGAPPPKERETVFLVLQAFESRDFTLVRFYAITL